MKNLRPFFSYFGGKWRIAPKYPAPTHETIIEPFAGSAGYSLRYPDRKVVLNDLNPKVAETWRYLIGATPDEIMALPVYDGTWESTDELDHLPIGARYLMGWWMNKGTVAPAKSPSKWMRSGDTGYNYWGPGARERIASQVPYIKHWRVLSHDYADLPPIEGTWFVDPPYQEAGKPYPAQVMDFPALGEWCRGLKGQVIVCENYGADWLPFERFVDAKANSSQGKAKVSKEAIWYREGA